MIMILKYVLMLMHVISLIQVPTKLHILEKGMTNLYAIFIDEIDIHNDSCLCVNDVNDSCF